jgi:DNA polymerase-1
MVKDLARAFGIPALEQKGYEADDLIGTIVRAVEQKHPDIEIVIVTGDLDTLQLIDAKTKVFTMRKGITDTVLYDEAAVRGRYGLRPRQLVDFKGLRGDPSDNIPGVKGIGQKTASELLKAHGSIEAIYQIMKKGKLVAKPAILAALKQHEADALFSKTLATIDRNVPVKFLLASARVRKAAWKTNARDELEKLGEPAAPALRQALENKPSLEVRRRIEELLEKAKTPTGENLRSLRAVQVLEHIGTDEARQVLKKLAEGAAGARLTQEAKASLERLGKRAAVVP